MADSTPKKKPEVPFEQVKARKPFFEAVGIIVIIVLVILLCLGWIFKQFNTQLNMCMGEKAELLNRCSAANEKVLGDMQRLESALKNAEYELSVADQRCAVGVKSLQDSLAEKNAALETQKAKIEELQWEVNRLKNELPSP